MIRTMLLGVADVEVCLQQGSSVAGQLILKVALARATHKAACAATCEMLQ